jgi:hypothetical protein
MKRSLREIRRLSIFAHAQRLRHQDYPQYETNSPAIALRTGTDRGRSSIFLPPGMPVTTTRNTCFCGIGGMTVAAYRFQAVATILKTRQEGKLTECHSSVDKPEG